MPLYSCKLCNYSTKYKRDFIKHENTKKHRKNLEAENKLTKETDHMNQNEPAMNQNEPQMNQNEPVKIAKKNQNEPAMNQKLYKCEFCESKFNTNASRRRHEKYRCKENPDFLDKLILAKNNRIKSLQYDKDNLEKDKQTLKLYNEKLEAEKKELYQQVSKLLDKVGDTNIQNNIILNNYGNEDLSHITDTLKTELLGMPYGAIPKMIEAIHFNDEKPENKNILLPNKKENLVKIFEGDKWIYKNKNETITDLVDSKYTIIDEHYEGMNNKQTIPNSMKTTFTKFKKFYEEGDEEMVANLKKQCELVLLNNR
tara:strand:+ start:244 stop:1179 length:936 start_codon:yes stop_codon:yes gene_type:complete